MTEPEPKAFSDIVQLQNDIVVLIDNYPYPDPTDEYMDMDLRPGIHLEKRSRKVWPNTPCRAEFRLREPIAKQMSIDSLHFYHLDTFEYRPGEYRDRIGSFYHPWNFIGEIPEIVTLNALALGIYLDPKTEAQVEQLLKDHPEYRRTFHGQCNRTMYYFSDDGITAARIIVLPEMIEDNRLVVGRSIFELAKDHKGGSIADLRLRHTLQHYILDTSILPGEIELVGRSLTVAKGELERALQEI